MSPYCFEHSTRHTPSECRATYAAAEAHAEKERAERAAEKRRQKAEEIATSAIRGMPMHVRSTALLIQHDDLRDALIAAVLAGMEAAR